MKTLKNNPPYNYLCSKQFNRPDFELEPVESCVHKFLKDCKNDINDVNLFKFIKFTFKTAKMVLNDYLRYFSIYICTWPIYYYFIHKNLHKFYYPELIDCWSYLIN